MGKFYFDLIKYDSSDQRGEICAIIFEKEDLKIERILDGMFKVMEIEWDAMSQYVEGEWDDKTQDLIRDDYLSGMVLIINMEIDKLKKELQKEHDFLAESDANWDKITKNKIIQEKLSEALNLEVDKFHGVGQLYESDDESLESVDNTDYEELVMRALRNGHGDKLGY